MKLFFIFLCCCLCLQSSVFAQNENDAPKRAQSVYGELGGNGLLFSANYDVRFLKSDKGFGMRAGLGFFGGSGGGLITVPVGLNYLAGKAPSYFEVGLGYTYASFTSSDDFIEGSGSILVPSVGYRFQPSKKGFTGRVILSPLIGLGEGGGWVMFGGISAGYKF
ncbi:hypothetical protein [Lacibacter sediminis]|uniref:Outer membrane beta-barrel protein n=1 Tax=Lacibacter sediminis TaxID=2760713 RepID=A0A7G5XJ89_9BACT|nr:hypothetical protein [Lacibacter sediminis]QNA45542.1 hypothetical protein H4075_04890 [Lacibacter sediminis]